MQEYLEIIITPDGKVRVETFGIKGSECEKLAEKVRLLLQARTEEVVRKPEYYESVQVDVGVTGQTVRQTRRSG